MADRKKRTSAENPRVYGFAPYSVALLHGGPGAAGEMAPVARELAKIRGVLEPLQTADTIEGQLNELREILEWRADRPVVLAGFSWGAMLAFMYAARFPGDVGKLILIASAAFEPESAGRILPDRLSRLTASESRELEALMARLDDPALREKGKGRALARLGEIMSQADAYRIGFPDEAEIEVDFHIYDRVWTEAKALRNDGRLIAMGASIQCPVLAIHGDYDPHPAEGVRASLSRVVKDFRFVLLGKCGHRPWLELEAREAFFSLLEKELAAFR